MSPVESPPVLGLKNYVYALVFASTFGLIRTRIRCENVRLVRESLPKIGEGSGGVDVEELLFVGPSRIDKAG